MSFFFFFSGDWCPWFYCKYIGIYMYVSIYNLEYRYVIVYRDYFIQVYYLDIFGLFDMHHKLVMDCTAVVRGETRCSSISTCCHRTRLTDIVVWCFVKIGDCTGDLSWEVSVSKSSNKWVVPSLGESVLVKDRFVRDWYIPETSAISFQEGCPPICRFLNEPKALETREEWRFTVYLNDNLGFSSSCVPIWENAKLGILWHPDLDKVSEMPTSWICFTTNLVTGHALSMPKEYSNDFCTRGKNIKWTPICRM